MSDRWNTNCAGLCDAIWGWTLGLPRDLTVVSVGVILAILLLAIRRLMTDRSLIQQISEDERRLRQLIREARAAADRDRLAVCYHVRHLVGRRRLSAEWKGTACALILLTVAMSWGQQRLDYLPTSANEPVNLTARFPASAIGEVVHIVPLEDASVANGWIRDIDADIEKGIPHGKAEWTVQFGNRPQQTSIVLRVGTQSIFHPLSVGLSRYEKPMRQHDGNIETEIGLTRYQPFGVIPWRTWPGVPGWSVLLTVVTGGVFWFSMGRMGRMRPMGPRDFA